MAKPSSVIHSNWKLEPIFVVVVVVVVVAVAVVAVTASFVSLGVLSCSFYLLSTQNVTHDTF
jgi:hypothetical protein